MKFKGDAYFIYYPAKINIPSQNYLNFTKEKINSDLRYRINVTLRITR
jgi:hypothetical protein